ncbi:MAG: tyrosine-type recombinase/integrase [Planctomycetota bacterium]|jgi:integrase
MSKALVTKQATGITQAADYQTIVDLVLDSLDSQASRRIYNKALGDFLAWHAERGRPTLSKALVQDFRSELIDSGLAPATINQRLSAIRALAREARDNDLIPATLAHGIENVKGVKKSGRRVGNWLTREQAQRLLDSPDTSTLKGLRDRAILAVMLGCGLRRSEVTSLTLDHIQEREGRWIICDLVGKRNRVRSVPMPTWAKGAIDVWAEAAGITEGYVFRSVGKGGKVSGPSMTPQAVFYLVKRYGAAIIPDLAPHDIRRTFARLSHARGASIDQIQLSLGHESVQTTESYINAQQILTEGQAPCDFLGLE